KRSLPHQNKPMTPSSRTSRRNTGRHGKNTGGPVARDPRSRSLLSGGPARPVSATSPPRRSPTSRTSREPVGPAGVCRTPRPTAGMGARKSLQEDEMQTYFPKDWIFPPASHPSNALFDLDAFRERLEREPWRRWITFGLPRAKGEAARFFISHPTATAYV